MEFTENAEPQTSQENGFYRVCVHMCLFKWIVHENDDPQNLQEYGSFLVCPQVCFCKVEPDMSQENGSLKHVHMWLFRVDLKENTVPQSSR